MHVLKLNRNYTIRMRELCKDLKAPKLLPMARVAKKSNQTTKVSVNGVDVEGKEILPGRLEDRKS